VYSDLINRIKIAIKDNVHSSAHLKSASVGVVRILCAMDRTWDRAMIMSSREKSGVSPVDFDRILKHCTKYHLFEQDILEVVQKMHKFIQIMRDKGEIHDKMYTTNLSPQLPDPLKWRDDRNVQNRRSIILTNKEFIKYEAEKSEVNEKTDEEKALKRLVRRGKRISKALKENQQVKRIRLVLSRNVARMSK
jgi:hypothetical protein